MAANAADVASAPNARDGAVVTVHVLSDIQGRMDHLRSTLIALRAKGPPPDALVVVGDLTDNGQPEQYDEVLSVLAAATEPDGIPIVCVIGNHEFYNGLSSAASIKRFLGRTGSGGVFGGLTIRDTRLVWIGTIDGSGDGGHDVVLGAEQLHWLGGELAATVGTRRHTLVFCHQPLPRTVSGTGTDPALDAWLIYDHDHAEPEELRAALAAPGNVLFLTGHTHYRLDRHDWCVDAGGFTAINTGAVHSSFIADGEGGERMLDAEDHSALRVQVGPGWTRVEALDVRAGVVVQDLTLPVAQRPAKTAATSGMRAQ